MKPKAKVKIKDSKKDEEKIIDGSKAEQRLKRELAVVSDIEKKFGQGSVGRASKIGFRSIPRLATGVFALDVALGGGWAKGRINLIWGPRSSCKTYLMWKMIAAAQKADAISNRPLSEVTEGRPFKCAFIDVEGAADIQWAEKLGVDLDELYYARPETAEQAAEMVESMVASGVFDIMVLDSLAAMTPQKELEGEMGDANVGAHARINNQMFRKLQSAMNKLHNEDSQQTPTFFVINQERQKIGVFFGSDKIKPGGLGQDFYTTIELHTAAYKMEYFDPEEKTMPKFAHFGFKVDKNKAAPPKVEGKFILAVANDPEGDFKAGDVMEDVTIHNYSERLGLFQKIDNTTWNMCGQIYKRKGDLIADWYQTPEKAQRLRRQMLHILFPQVFPHALTQKEGDEGRSVEVLADPLASQSAASGIDPSECIPA